MRKKAGRKEAARVARPKRRRWVLLKKRGRPGGARQPLPLIVGVLQHLSKQRRPGADDGHVPLQDVDQLGQLIQPSAAALVLGGRCLCSEELEVTFHHLYSPKIVGGENIRVVVLYSGGWGSGRSAA